jgi:hypothetical protein
VCDSMWGESGPIVCVGMGCCVVPLYVSKLVWGRPRSSAEKREGAEQMGARDGSCDGSGRTELCDHLDDDEHEQVEEAEVWD